LGGGRSAAAQSYLINQGFKTVVNLTGGITSWKAKNLPVEGKKEVEQLSQKAFLQSMPKNELVLVDFSAEWCPPCKKMNPIVDELIKEGYSILKIDGGSQDELVKSYQIGSFPTLVLFKNGEEIKRVSGFQTKESLIELFK
jgi:thioredoxin